MMFISIQIPLRCLRNMHTGYAGVTTQQMMDHLYQNYGVITTVNIKDNDIRMREPYVQCNLSDGYILSSDINSGGRICHCRQAAISKNRPSRQSRLPPCLTNWIIPRKPFVVAIGIIKAASFQKVATVVPNVLHCCCTL